MVFLLLVKLRYLSVLNTLRDSLRRTPWVAAGLAILGILLFGGTFAGFSVFFNLAGEFGALKETTYQVFYFLFLFLLAGSVPFVAATLLHSTDYGLLFSAPIAPRSVVAAKLLDATVTNSLQFSVLGIPAMVACAAALSISPWGWMLLPLLILLFVLLPALLTAVGLLLLLTVMGLTRLRSAVTGLNALMAVVVCVTVVMESSHLPVRPGGDIFAAQSSLNDISPAAHRAPSAWFAEALLALVSPGGHRITPLVFALGKIILLVAALYAASMILGGRLLSAANLADERSGGRFQSRGELTLLGGLLTTPVGAMLSKDWKYLLRDSILFSQLIMPLILYIVPFLIMIKTGQPQMRDEIFPLSSSVIGVILFMQTSILSLSSIGLESRSFWIVMASPNTARTLLRAKFLLSTTFSAAVAVVLTIISAALFRAPLPILFVQTILVILMSAGLSGLGVGLSAAFPRFVYENPAHRVSPWALILGFFASTGYVLISGILFSIAWLLAINAPGGNLPVLIYGGAFLIFLLLTAYAIYAPLTLGAQRLERYQWEH